jgi:hypothetical protein
MKKETKPGNQFRYKYIERELYISSNFLEECVFLNYLCGSSNPPQSHPWSYKFGHGVESNNSTIQIHGEKGATTTKENYRNIIKLLKTEIKNFFKQHRGKLARPGSSSSSSP